MGEGMGAAVPTESIELQNVVGSAALGRELDLLELATDLNGTEYDPDEFAGLLYRTDASPATVMAFSSGKVTVTGATGTGEMRRAFGEFVAGLEEIGLSLSEPPEVSVQNMVATADLGEEVNLTAAALGLDLERVEYEPEVFPGLVYRLESPDVVVLLFGSGKIVVTGATDRASIERAVETVASQLTDLGLLDQ